MSWSYRASVANDQRNRPRPSRSLTIGFRRPPDGIVTKVASRPQRVGHVGQLSDVRLSRIAAALGMTIPLLIGAVDLGSAGARFFAVNYRQGW